MRSPRGMPTPARRVAALGRGRPLTDQQSHRDGDRVPTLQELVRSRTDERGWSYGELSARSGGRISKARFGQLGAGRRLREFPEPSTIEALADALEIDVTSVILAVARSLGLDVRRRGPDLAHLLPAGTDRLSPAMRDAILAFVRAAVAEAVQSGDDDDRGAAPADDEVPVTLQWSPRSSASTRSNAHGRPVDRRG